MGESRSCGHWLGLKLEGTKSNRGAVGARVKVELEDGRKIFRVVQPGGSFGDSPLELHVGLAAATQVRAIEVQWPGGGVVTVPGVVVDRVYRLREGEPVLQAMPVRAYSFRKNGGAHLH